MIGNSTLEKKSLNLSSDQKICSKNLSKRLAYSLGIQPIKNRSCSLDHSRILAEVSGVWFGFCFTAVVSFHRSFLPH